MIPARWKTEPEHLQKPPTSMFVAVKRRRQVLYPSNRSARVRSHPLPKPIPQRTSCITDMLYTKCLQVFCDAFIPGGGNTKAIPPFA